MRVKVLGFMRKEWLGELKGKTANNMSVIRDDAGRDWAVPNQQVFNIVPLKIGYKVRSTIGEGYSRFVIVTTELDMDTGEELYICRSRYSTATWDSRKRYAYSSGELERWSDEQS